MFEIPLIKPYIPESAAQSISEVLKSGYLTEGPVTKEFEQRIKSYLDCQHAIAVCNCTVGLEAALRCLKIGPGDEVIVPDFTYPATASVVHLVGATPVIVDTAPGSMLIDWEAAETAITEKTKAVMPVSILGQPLDYDAMDKFCKQHNLYSIEDAACSLGATFNGTKVGCFADITVFSCHPRKFITTGEGGIITTNNDDFALWLDSYKHFGRVVDADRQGMQFDNMGTNYKLSNLLAAVGLAQMGIIDEMLSQRIARANRYNELFSEVSGVELIEFTTHAQPSYQTYAIYVDNRDKILSNLRAKGIEAQICSYTLHSHRAFQNPEHCRLASSFSNASDVSDRSLALPLYHEMTDAEQDRVVESLISELNS